ncbi:hypothetical protein ACP70R_011480 [Stipagrostis hirtigluma subsp. patula]
MPPPPMEPPRTTWADLPPELLSCVADRLHAAAPYVAARAVCAAWRSALPPPSPSLLVADAHGSAFALSLPLRCAFLLSPLPNRSRCVGSGHGWLAVACEEDVSYQDPDLHCRNFVAGAGWRVVGGSRRERLRIVLLNPCTGERIALPQHARLNPDSVSKIAFASIPRAGDFTVVAACGLGPLARTIAYIRTRVGGGGGATWSFEEIPGGTVLADVVYHDGDGEEDGGDKVYCLTANCDVYVLHIRPRKNPVLEPLLADFAGGAVSYPAHVFAPTYAQLSGIITGAKNLVFCDGNLYQVWRNTTGGAFRFMSPEGGGDAGEWFQVSEDEVFVLRYYPARRPCWEAVGDLGGHSVFVAPASDAVAVRAEGVPGLKVDCVYWTSRVGDRRAMVFDMKARRSTPCLAPSTDTAGRPVCWYFFRRMAIGSNDDDGEILQPQQKCSRLSKNPSWMFL